ncbi:DUF4596 domain containing protein [Scophthalmus maximus]|uniref:DUF4596 domain containing protein n=1 Tax=Scophthalmus maximus TaxID=52904 RepID=A0A2U9BNZ8_SCOMX|nr:DUF4596 domain containing protein [Scophthalmus maximus]
MTTASNSNAQSTGESCIKSPGIFSLEELPEEAKEPGLIPQPLTQPCLAAAEQQYIECGKQEAESAELVLEEAAGSEEATDPLSTLPKPEEHPDDIQPPYYSAICEKTENSFAELQESDKGQAVLLSPSSGLCTIYEALENSDEEEAGDEDQGVKELNPSKEKKVPNQETSSQGMDCDSVRSDKVIHQESLPSTENPPTPPSHTDAPHTPSIPSQDRDCFSPSPPESPERPPPLDLDWGKKVDIVQQLINQTLLLNGDGCSSLLRMPGGAGGTLSPLESSLWPSLLPPLTPPSATVTSVSSFSPEATGSSPQGEWTVVELETHH